MKTSEEDAAKAMKSVLNQEGNPMFRKEEFRMPTQIHNYFGTLALKKKLECAISELAVEVSLCTISLKIAGMETEVHICEVEIVAWLADLKMTTLKSVAKQLGIFKNLKEKSNIKRI